MFHESIQIDDPISCAQPIADFWGKYIAIVFRHVFAFMIKKGSGGIRKAVSYNSNERILIKRWLYLHTPTLEKYTKMQHLYQLILYAFVKC